MKPFLMKRFIFNISILLLWNSWLVPAQQSIFDNMRNVPTLSPQAASFAKYVEFPTGLYNGIPPISIPLYTIKSGDITMPVTLSYHAGGIKVAEEAGPVGLGWNLQVGGVISRQIKGKDDNVAVGNYIGKILPNGNSNYDENYSIVSRQSVCNAFDNNGNAMGTHSTNEVTNIALNGEGEPDIYTYNFNGYTGKFFITGSNPQVLHDLSRNNIIFNVTYDEKITATTPDGYVYDFFKNENGMVTTSSLSDVQTLSSSTSYYLTGITSPTGRKISFEYEEFGAFVHQLSPTFEVFSGTDCGSGCNVSVSVPYLQPSPFTGVESNMEYLKKIIFDEGYVEFTNDTRQDSYGYKMHNFVVYYNNGTPFKSFTFNQSYFIGTYSNHYLEGQQTSDFWYYPENYLSKRLKLNSVTETGGSAPPLTHQFEYYEGGDYTLPYKSSYAVDYWGYYNGQTGNTGFIPYDAANSLTVCYIPEIKNYAGSNRFANETYAKSWMLKKIIYPTQGWTEYEYSLNKDLDNFLAPSLSRHVILADTIDFAGGTGVKEKTFILSQIKAVTVNVSLMCDCMSNDCYCNGQGQSWGCGALEYYGNGAFGFDNNILYAALFKLNLSTNKFEVYQSSPDYVWDMTDVLPCGVAGKSNDGNFEKDVTLEPGTYKIVANSPDNKPFRNNNIDLADIRVAYTETYSAPPEGGGLRVTKITHYDPVTDKALATSYDYSGGTFMNFPIFAWQSFYYLEGSDGSTGNTSYCNCSKEYLYANSITPFSPSSNGNMVGYSTVTETVQDGQQGKTVYQYNNQPDNFGDSYPPGIPATPHLDNGFLNEVDVYDKNDNIIKKTISTPQVANPETFWAFKCDLQTNYSGGGLPLGLPPCNTYWTTNFSYYFYPIQMGKLVQQQTIEQDYVNTAHILQTTHDYEYNAQALLKTDKTTQSNNKVLSTEYKYTEDYTKNGWISDMWDKNMIGKPLETFMKVDNNVVSGNFIEYKTAGSLTTPHNVYKVAVSQPKVVASTSPDATVSGDFILDGTIEYNSSGNIKTTQKADNITTVYIWSYKNNYPIAKIENADSTTVNTVLGGVGAVADFGQEVTPTEEEIKTFLAPLFTDTRLKTAMITTYSYDPLIGMTSSTDPAGVTTHYEYDTFGRLKCIKDDDGRILKTYEYNYQQ